MSKISRRKAAERIGISPATLLNYEKSGVGPTFTRLRGLCLYAVADLDDWVKSRTVGESK